MESIIEAFGNKNPLSIYKFIETYKELLQINIAFLEGKINGTPYHFGYVENQDNKLIQLNKYGFMTMDYYKGTCKYRIKKDGLFYSYEYKSYISGYLEKKYINNLINYLSNNKIFKYFIVNNPNKYSCFKPKKILHTTLKELPSNIIRNKYSKNMYRLEEIEWENYTNIYSYDDMIILFDKYPKIKKILKDLVYVVIISNDYGEFFVEDLLLDFFIFVK